MIEQAVRHRVLDDVDLAELQEPAWLYRGRVPGLDGLRGLAILMVCAFHASWTVGWPEKWVPLGRQGEIGVDLFLSISGFLITLLLVRSLLSAGKIDLVGFYRRRTLRILPAYVCYLLVMGILHQRNFVHIEDSDWRAALTYTVNFVHKPHWMLLHTWSLSMEEQFYLLWPLALSLLGRQKLLKTVLCCLLVLPLIRWGIWRHDFALFAFMDGRHPVVRLDALLTGCALGLAVFLPAFRRAAALTTGTAYFLAMVSLGVIFTAIRPGIIDFYPSVFFRLLYALAIATLLWVAVNQKAPLLSWFLRCRIMVSLGAISYSLYLWQEVFLFPESPMGFMRWPINAVLALTCGAVSYFLIERPFLRLKERGARQDSNRQPAAL